MAKRKKNASICILFTYTLTTLNLQQNTTWLSSYLRFITCTFLGFDVCTLNMQANFSISLPSLTFKLPNLLPLDVDFIRTKVRGYKETDLKDWDNQLMPERILHCTKQVHISFFNIFNNKKKKLHIIKRYITWKYNLLIFKPTYSALAHCSAIHLSIKHQNWHLMKKGFEPYS